MSNSWISVSVVEACFRLGTCSNGMVGRAFTRKKGRANITVDDLVRTITPKGRGVFT